MRDFLKKRYIWIPALLAIYFIFMAVHFGMQLLENGESLKFWLTIVAETLVLLALSYVMRRRQILSEEREEDQRDSR